MEASKESPAGSTTRFLRSTGLQLGAGKAASGWRQGGGRGGRGGGSGAVYCVCLGTAPCRSSTEAAAPPSDRPLLTACSRPRRSCPPPACQSAVPAGSQRARRAAPAALELAAKPAPGQTCRAQVAWELSDRVSISCTGDNGCLAAMQGDPSPPAGGAPQGLPVGPGHHGLVVRVAGLPCCVLRRRLWQRLQCRPCGCISTSRASARSQPLLAGSGVGEGSGGGTC